MKELHITIPVTNDAEVETLVDRVALEAAALDIDTIGYHVHDHTAPPSGDIVGWRVVQPPVERDFETHAEAERYQHTKGGDLYPIFAEEVAHV